MQAVGVDPTTAGVILSVASGDNVGPIVKQAIVQAAGSAAAAGCSALGAPAVAPICSELAQRIAGPIIDAIGGALDDIFGSTPVVLTWDESWKVGALLQVAIADASYDAAWSLGMIRQALRDAYAGVGLPDAGAYDPLGAFLIEGLPLVRVEDAKRERTELERQWQAEFQGHPDEAWLRAAGDKAAVWSRSNIAAPLLWSFAVMPPDWRGQASAADLAHRRHAAPISTKSYEARLRTIGARVSDWSRALRVVAVFEAARIATAAAQRDAAVQAGLRSIADANALIALSWINAAKALPLARVKRDVVNGIQFMRINDRPATRSTAGGLLRVGGSLAPLALLPFLL